MTYVEYTVRRGLQPGSTVGQTNQFDFTPMSLDFRQTTQRNESVSISGVTQNVIWRRDLLRSLKTDFYEMGSQSFYDMYEFLESVDEFEPFIIDVDGSTSSHLNESSAILTKNYTRTRLSVTNFYSFDFEIRILS